jgi:hypothetical protein
MDEKEEFQVYDDIDGSAGMDAEELFSIFPQFFSLFFFHPGVRHRRVWRH